MDDFSEIRLGFRNVTLCDISESESFILPTTKEELNELLDELVSRYKLPNREHAQAVVCNQIQRMPPEQALSSLQFLGHCILKNIAYNLARATTSEMHHKLQIDEMAAHLKTQPHDQQALDELQKAVNEGSAYAKEILDQYRPVDAGNVISITAPSPTLEPAG